MKLLIKSRKLKESQKYIHRRVQLEIRLKNLYINKQAGELNTGLGDANGGIKEINEGLTDAKDKSFK